MTDPRELELATQVDAAFSPEALTEFYAMTGITFEERWNKFVDFAVSRVPRVEEISMISRTDLTQMQQMLVDMDMRSPKETNWLTSVFDIYANGFVAVRQDGNFRSVEQKMRNSGKSAFTIDQAECEIHILFTYPTPKKRLAQLGLHVIEILSDDKEEFIEYPQIFVPAVNLVKR
ncbi:hypothetical protein A3F37_01935 [Candidatus Saccharibacteria bacterium RIFCSPHIGHO2_12_FULL_41_12]|nr:MAG: hypothetical protein A3F37_01935 [Candidatus Saccharibacteria bacterium RIFCSPHIGHO2_12_FULL_41_12]